MVTLNAKSATKSPATAPLATSIICLLMLCWVPLGWAESFIASVNRTNIGLNETVELTLRSDKQQFFSTPDLSPLAEHFDIIGQRQSSQFTITNGKSVSWTDWIVELRPKRAGFVVVPPIVLDNLATDPITLKVAKTPSQSDQPQTAATTPVYIESSVDLEEVYVQQQIIYTLRIVHSVPLFDDSQLSDLKIENAIVQSLGEPTARSEVINGTRHGVFELQYAIYPQRSGDLVIPSQIFTATAADQANRFDPFQPRPGKRLAIRSPEISIRVNAAPPDRNESPWIPARELTLQQQWSGDPTELKVGDSITRTLILQADGLTFAQLPPLVAAQIDGLNAYPDKPQSENRRSENGILGTTRLSSAYVATEPGEYQLPSITLEWFDTQLGESRMATLPEQVITVIAPAAPKQTAIVPPPSQPVEQAPRPASPATVGSQGEFADLTPWKWSTAILGCLWVATLFWGFTRRRQNPSPQLPEQGKESAESIAYRLLIDRMEQGQSGPEFIQALRRWLAELLQASTGTPLIRLCETTTSPELITYVLDYEQALYSEQTGSTPEPRTLLPTIKKIRKAHFNTSKKEELRPLYG
ncbi:BatD family protein [Aestuariirhabdus sp. LZHN29]|uniref:BatD family protein n=1 Tax=Aestuariirhabdus sp. LZHN29 TaxID=3417462 RepID=UPI003CF3B9A9